MKKIAPASLLVVLLCIGCDTAAKQQRAEDVRRSQTQAELKQLGETMQNTQSRESPPAVAPDSQTPDPDASEQESVPDSADRSASVADGAPETPASTK